MTMRTRLRPAPRTAGVVALVWSALSSLGSPARSATTALAPGTSVQAAVDAAAPGDVLALSAGTWVGDVDFRGKAIVVRGSGPATILEGTGTGPVVRFVSGETSGAVLESLTVTGGLADQGGGILVRGASPTIVRTVITANRAAFAGSGVYLEASQARLYNNLVSYNSTAAGDPHSVQINGGSPALVNNTIVRGDSNGILVGGGATPLILNNVLAANGSRPAGDDVRGRGICDFGPATVIQYNVFYRNRRAALLSADFVDYRRIRAAERALAVPRIAGNLDVSPRFADEKGFAPRPTSRAVHAGHPDPAFANPDGSRNTIGHTGGPFALAGLP